jgi:uncharacterized repeat protein (TIGR01451 family)
VLYQKKLRCLALSLLLSVCAFAQAAGEIQSSLQVSRVVAQADGTEAHQSADKARPGDLLEYVAQYRNTTLSPIRQLVPTLPIPTGMEFIPDTALPAGALASIDGSNFSPIPLKRRVVDASGKLVDEAVPYREYRFLRWPAQDLAPGKTLQFGARARMSK